MYRFFSPRLYAQGLKRLLPISAICGILVAAFYVIDPVTSLSVMASVHSTYKPDPFICNTGGAALFLSLFFIPFIVFSAFSFLFKRTSSDFYHSLPQSRACVVTSLFSSCLTCIFAVIGFAVCMKLLLPNFYLSTEHVSRYLVFSPSLLPALLLHVSLWALVLAAISLFAVCLAGKKGSAILLFFTSLIYPFLYVIMFSKLLISIVPSIGIAASLYSLSNLFSVDLFDLGSFFRSDIFRESSITPVILGIAFVLFTALGFLSYVYRKSETASTAVNSEKGRAALRIFVCLPFITYALFNALEITLSYSYISTSSVYGNVVLPFAISILLWFIFELVTKKQVSSALSSFKQLPILLAFCIALGGSALIIRESVLSFSPEADEIESIVIDEYKEIQQVYTDMPQPYRYDGERISGFVLSSDASKEILCSALDSRTEAVKSKNASYDRLSHVKLTFNLKNGRKVARYVSASLNGASLMQTLGEGSNEFADKFFVLPEDRNSLDVYFLGGVYQCFSGSSDNSAIYKAFEDDLASVSKEEKAKAFFPTSRYTIIPYIEVRGTSSDTYGTYAIPASFVNTRQTLIDTALANEGCVSSYNKTANLIQNVASGEAEITHVDHLYMTLTSNKTDVLTFDLMSFISISEEDAAELMTLLHNDSLLLSYPDAKASYVSFELFLDSSLNSDEYYPGIYAISEETAVKITDLLSGYLQ